MPLRGGSFRKIQLELAALARKIHEKLAGADQTLGMV
jgi:hypothetical protein